MIEAPTGNIGYSKVAGHREEDTPVGYKRTEVGLVPEDWSISTVGAEFRVQLGKMLDAAKNQGVSKPYVGNRSIQWGHVNVDAIETVSLTPVELNRFLLRRGDLLVCEGGEIGRAAIWNDPIPECYYQKALHRLRPIRGYNSLLMMFLLRLWATTGFLTNFATRTSIAHLPKENFETIPLPVPLDHEQRAIVEALSDVDKSLESLDALIAKKRAIKKAAMQQLLTGRTRLPGFSGKWERRQLKHVLDCLDHVRIPLNESQRAKMPGSYPYCGANGVLDYVNDFVLDDDVILIAEDGGYFDEYTHRPIAYRMSGKIWVNNHAHILKAKSGYSQGFLYLSLVHKNILPYLASGTRAKLNKSEMNKIEIYLPLQVAEQTIIAEFLLNMDSEITALEQRREKTHAIKEGMMQELLTGRVRLIEPSDQLVKAGVAP